MKKFKTITEQELIEYAIMGITKNIDGILTAIRGREERGEDFHELEANYNALEKQWTELLKYKWRKEGAK